MSSGGIDEDDIGLVDDTGGAVVGVLVVELDSCKKLVSTEEPVGFTISLLDISEILLVTSVGPSELLDTFV